MSEPMANKFKDSAKMVTKLRELSQGTGINTDILSATMLGAIFEKKLKRPKAS